MLRSLTYKINLRYHSWVMLLEVRLLVCHGKMARGRPNIGES